MILLLISTPCWQWQQIARRAQAILPQSHHFISFPGFHGVLFHNFHGVQGASRLKNSVYILSSYLVTMGIGNRQALSGRSTFQRPKPSFWSGVLFCQPLNLGRPQGRDSWGHMGPLGAPLSTTCCPHNGYLNLYDDHTPRTRQLTKWGILPKIRKLNEKMFAVCIHWKSRNRNQSKWHAPVMFWRDCIMETMAMIQLLLGGPSWAL